MLVGADQINAALRRSVTLMGQPGVIDNMNAAIAAFASRTAHRQQRRAVQAAEMPRGIHVGLAIDEIQQSEAVADALQQPGGLARQRHRRVQSGIARPRSFPMSGRLQQAATRQRRRPRQPSGIDHGADGLLLGGQQQHSLLEQPGALRTRRNEVSAAAGVENILVSRQTTLLAVTVQQSRPRPSCNDFSQLPTQVVSVLNAAISAAAAERANLMRAVSGEHHRSMHEASQPAATEGIDADPFKFEIDIVAEHPAQPGRHALRLALQHWVCIRPQLEIDAPDIIRLFVDQD
ncbi:hypothetical protein CV_1803 [Chromobacterium violaceum ATCC 12472]|uniref:Uncharacterized protein n=1 Tax=Chromobacterium violaceum (strain ATCC 12472 / DSM 30191 / JCM 1249 / CCUG 213 / NBRC 12614 / NCIMB 9131 / NCTC 9757 / MK) TaxID=243365 RepID=Q7NX26_CHRVO|nr:hypothetical protein CV_1803 [Chromobacterium violaceum ATCC 12472]